MRRIQATMPLTPQEQAVKDLLIERRLPFEAHDVFELSRAVTMSVDFLIFVGASIVLECTHCARPRGYAISEVGRRGAFINYRFGLLKGAFPKLTCGALIEAPNEDQSLLDDSLRRIFTSADLIATSLHSLTQSLKPRWYRHDLYE